MPAVLDVIRSICLSLPGTEETTGHGSPDFKVEGKTFATFRINHHGDGLVCLLLFASKETQEMYVSSAPDIFFVPSYVGPKGWYGIDLAQGMKWDRVAQLAFEAYCSIAPKKLLADANPATHVPTPDTVDYRDLDPLYSKENQARLATIREVCLGFPEVIEDDSFGSPNFRAGKKSFCQFSCYSGPALTVWVGKDRQVALTADKRYHIPSYMGHNGWISLSLSRSWTEDEISGLIEESYRHFALKRMLKALDGE